jgi:DNA-directed RNA polymerase beta' subunit
MKKEITTEAVDTLMANRENLLKSAINRPLKSLSDISKLRLGFPSKFIRKRVDYSGRL